MNPTVTVNRSEPTPPPIESVTITMSVRAAEALAHIVGKTNGIKSPQTAGLYAALCVAGIHPRPGEAMYVFDQTDEGEILFWGFDPS